MLVCLCLAVKHHQRPERQRTCVLLNYEHKCHLIRIPLFEWHHWMWLSLRSLVWNGLSWCWLEDWQKKLTLNVAISSCKLIALHNGTLLQEYNVYMCIYLCSCAIRHNRKTKLREYFTFFSICCCDCFLILLLRCYFWLALFVLASSLRSLASHWSVLVPLEYLKRKANSRSFFQILVLMRLACVQS